MRRDNLQDFDSGTGQSLAIDFIGNVWPEIVHLCYLLHFEENVRSIKEKFRNFLNTMLRDNLQYFALGLSQSRTIDGIANSWPEIVHFR